MESSIIIIGYITLAKDQLEEWRGCPMDPERFEWLESGVFSGSTPGRYQDVGEWLDALEVRDSVCSSEPSYLAVDTADDGEQVMITGCIVDEDSFFAWHQDLATAARMAGTIGASGEVFVILPTEEVGWTIEIGGDSEIVVLEAEDVAEAAAEHSAELTIIGNYMQAQLTGAAPPSRRDFYQAERGFQLGDLADAPAQQQVLDVLGQRNPHELWHIAQIVELETPHGTLLASELATADELAAAIAERAPVMRVVGIELLAEIEPAAVEPLALELCHDSSPYVRTAAMMALGRIGTDAALDVLLDIPDTYDSAMTGQITAIGIIEHPEVDGRLRALLESECFRSATYDVDEDDPPAMAAAERAFFKARLILQMIGQRSMESAAPVLLALFEEPPVQAMREAVVETMLEVGGPEIESESERIQYFLHGMGLALNQDDVRRSQILGMPDADEPGGMRRFEGLTVHGLKTLLDESFIHPYAQHNEAPSTVEFLEIMEEWPEITAGGYAVSRDRNDYRVNIDSISCALDKAAPERRVQLRETFLAVATEANASLVDGEGDHLSASWSCVNE